MFRPVGCNALDLEFRPGKPLSTEIRRRIVDLYERDRGKSHQQFVLLMAECVAPFVIRHYQTYGTYFPLSQEGRRNPSKLSDNGLESIALFKLMKPSMFGRETRERLLNDGVCDGRILPVLSTVNKGIKIKLHIINKYSIKQRLHPSLFLQYFHKYRTFHL